MNSGSFINVVIKPTLLLIEMRVTVLQRWFNPKLVARLWWSSPGSDCFKQFCITVNSLNSWRLAAHRLATALQADKCPESSKGGGGVPLKAGTRHILDNPESCKVKLKKPRWWSGALITSFMLQFYVPWCDRARNRRWAHMGEHLSVWVSDRKK